MKSWRIVAVLLLCLVLIGSLSCRRLGGEQEATEQLVKVVRGDLTVAISGNGNIEVSNEMKLTFGVGGRVDKIYVEEGDKVNKGDVLAELETDALELAVTQAQFAVTQAQVAVTQAQVAITQAQLNLETAKYDLEHTQELHLWTEISAAQGELADAEDYLESALRKLSLAPPGSASEEAWQKAVFYAEKRLNTAKNRLEAMLAGTDTELVALKKQQIELSEQSLEQARQSEELARQSEELARQSLAQAEKQLNDATITAPFDGVVASVNVDENDTVSTAITIIYLIDPGKMELNLDVDEIDVAEVKPGQKAVIEVDALPDLLLEGKVSYISQLPREEGGVIVFEVKIGFDVAEGSGLRGGMSASADIIINKRSNVLLVPNRAIKQDSQGNTIVEVTVNGQIEERTVVPGISDGFQTEIIEGLEEGEVVIERRAGT